MQNGTSYYIPGGNRKIPTARHIGEVKYWHVNTHLNMAYVTQSHITATRRLHLLLPLAMFHGPALRGRLSDGAGKGLARLNRPLISLGESDSANLQPPTSTQKHSLCLLNQERQTKNPRPATWNRGHCETSALGLCPTFCPLLSSTLF